MEEPDLSEDENKYQILVLGVLIMTKRSLLQGSQWTIQMLRCFMTSLKNYK